MRVLQHIRISLIISKIKSWARIIIFWDETAFFWSFRESHYWKLLRVNNITKFLLLFWDANSEIQVADFCIEYLIKLFFQNNLLINRLMNLFIIIFSALAKNTFILQIRAITRRKQSRQENKKPKQNSFVERNDYQK